MYQRFIFQSKVLHIYVMLLKYTVVMYSSFWVTSSPSLITFSSCQYLDIYVNGYVWQSCMMYFVQASKAKSSSSVMVWEFN